MNYLIGMILGIAICIFIGCMQEIFEDKKLHKNAPLKIGCIFVQLFFLISIGFL